MDAPNDLGPVTWEPFVFDDMNYLYINNESVVVGKEYRQKDYAFWTEYIAYIIRDVLPENAFHSVLGNCLKLAVYGIGTVTVDSTEISTRRVRVYTTEDSPKSQHLHWLRL